MAKSEDESKKKEADAGGKPSSARRKKESEKESEARVVVSDPSGKKTTFALDRPKITVGRESSCQIQIRDAKASRKHFEIEMAGQYFVAVDLGSTNGLRVNGRRVKRRLLRDGDEMVVGQFKLVYHGPTDESTPDELMEAEEEEKKKKEEKEEEGKEGKEEEEGEKKEGKRKPEGKKSGKKERKETTVEPETEADPVNCPNCEVELIPHQACAKCGFKGLRQQAMEYFVDHVVRSQSVLSGLGLFGLTRSSKLEKVYSLTDVPWVLRVHCGKCDKVFRVINEFRPRCLKCEGCGEEISLPVLEPPAV